MVAASSQRELAERLGVSAMTVSRALRGGEGISSELRHRILQAARANGLPAPAKHRDANGLLHVLCSMAPEPATVAGDSPFHGRLLDGLRRGVRECGSELLNCPEVSTSWPLVVIRQQVDGAVLVWGDEHDPKPVGPCPVPAVYVFYGPPQCDIVTADNFHGGLELGRHLASLGHRQVAFVGPDSRVAIERLAGLRAGLESSGGGVPSALALLERGGASGHAPLADDLLAVARPAGGGRLGFTAVMAYNDYAAVGLIQRFGELGIRVPEDVSVAGFDGVAPTAYRGPSLCTCVIPLEELGAEAARMVYWRLEHPTAVRRRVSLETALGPGESVRRL